MQPWHSLPTLLFTQQETSTINQIAFALASLKMGMRVLYEMKKKHLFTKINVNWNKMEWAL